MELGRYKLGRKLGAGGMGEVFLAHASGAEGFEKPVALKRIFRHISADEDYRRLFIREAKVSARLSHPNIVQVFDLGEEDDELFIAMELVDGPSLAELLEHLDRSDQTLSPEIAAVVAFDVLEALVYAQEVPGEDGRALHLVHRDISPHNILVQRAGGFAKLCDFGVAKGHGVAQATRGKVVGKSSYMAPEQAVGDDIDGRADLYSLGAVIFEAVSGQPAQAANNIAALVDVLMHGKSPRLGESAPDLPTPFIELIDRALEREPDARYNTAVDFRAAIERYLGSVDARAARGQLRDLACELEDTVVSKMELPTERVPRGTDRWQTLIGEDELDGTVVTPGPSSWDAEFDTTPGHSDHIYPGTEREPQRALAPAALLSRWQLWVALVLIGSAAALAVFLATRSSVEPPPPVVTVSDTPNDHVEPIEDVVARQQLTEDLEASDEPPPENAREPLAKRKQRRRGYLNINVRPWAKVVIDGVELPKPTPLRRHPLPPGRHSVVLQGPDGKQRSLTVTIRSGKTVTKILSFE